MDTLRKNKIEIGRANQACEELKSRMKMYTDTQNSPNQGQIDRLQKNVTQLEKSLSTKFEELQARKPMSRTVSLGPDTGDVKKLRAEQAEMVKKLEDFKAQISPVMNEFRTGNLMSPAMSGIGSKSPLSSINRVLCSTIKALHEQLVAVKTESDNVRKQLHDHTARTDQNHHENKIRMRTLIDEVKALKEAKEAEVVEGKGLKC